MLALILSSFVACIAGAISVARSLAVVSESECFSRLWARAILSEYDRHLLEDYGIMAYFGSEKEVNEKLDRYADYSLQAKLDAKIGRSSSYLGDYVLADTDNFAEALSKSFAYETGESIIQGSARIERAENTSESDRVIRNQVVIDTLPSQGIQSEPDTAEIKEKIENAGSFESLISAGGRTATEMNFVKLHMGNYLYAADNKECFLQNEWEYIISGKLSDLENYSSCRAKLFAIRNALNLVAIYKDPAKTAVLAEIAELITPGPAGLITQAVLAEAWAAAETEADLRKLYSRGRVPLIKNADEWQISLRSIVSSDKFMDELEEEAKKQLEEKSEEIGGLAEGVDSALKEFTRGQTYEDYLLVMMLAVNDNVRLLRIMDIVQINMKLRYYRDFSLEEYYVGTEIAIEANGREYEVEDRYN